MKRNPVYWTRGVFCLLVCIAVTGCATAQPSGRRGLLEETSVSDQRLRSGSVHSSDIAVSGRTPAGHSVGAVAVASNVGKRLPDSNPLRHPAVEISASSLHWPLQQVQITSPFGKRGKEFHEGIDLKAQQGTPVLAAQDGTVIYAGSKIRGYGKLIVIRHQRQLSTIYAHNSQLLVRAGQYVHQGQKISVTGQTGHVTGPHLHFEVRDGLAALNPMPMLPSLHAVEDLSPGPAVPAKAPKRLAVAARSQRVAAAAHPVRRASYNQDSD